jgi:hypothetical protein
MVPVDVDAVVAHRVRHFVDSNIIGPSNISYFFHNRKIFDSAFSKNFFGKNFFGKNVGKCGKKSKNNKNKKIHFLNKNPQSFFSQSFRRF